MKVSTSAFYAWIKQPETTDKKKQEKVLEAKVSELFMIISKRMDLGAYLMR